MLDAYTVFVGIDYENIGKTKFNNKSSFDIEVEEVCHI